MNPVYKTKFSAGADLTATASIIVNPGETHLVPTGAYMPPQRIGCALQCGILALRSSVALNTPLVLKNGIGVIDPDYQDEIKVMVTNIGTEPYIIHTGDRIAQLVIVPFVQAYHVSGDERLGGFGSTGQ